MKEKEVVQGVGVKVESPNGGQGVCSFRTFQTLLVRVGKVIK